MTYELMASYWPTPEAKENDPEVAEGMNTCRRSCSRERSTRRSWNNTKLVKGDLAAEVRKLKKEPGTGHGDHGQRQHRLRN